MVPFRIEDVTAITADFDSPTFYVFKAVP